MKNIGMWLVFVLVIMLIDVHAGPIFLVNSCSKCQPLYQNPLAVNYSLHKFTLDLNDAMPLDPQDLTPKTTLCIKWIDGSSIKHILKFNSIDLDQMEKYSKDQKLYIYFDETINPLCKKSQEIYLAWFDMQGEKHTICFNSQLQGDCQFPIIIPFRPLAISRPPHSMK